MAGNIDISQENVIPVVFSCDDNYVQHLYCAITSVIKNKAANDLLKIYILIDSFKDENKKLLKHLCDNNDIEIAFIKINKDDFENCPMKSSCPHITIATYYRFVLASILPQADKVIYLDCDITVQSSLRELYDTDLTDYYFAGVQDILYNDSSKRMNLEKYCNVGVMLINLKKWREEDIEQKLFKYAAENRKKLKWQDQDVLNDVLQSGILYLDSKWNCQVGQYPLCFELGFNKTAKKASILHYIGRAKPWDDCCLAPLKIKMSYFEILLHTPFAKKIPCYIFSQLLYSVQWVIRKIYMLFYILTDRGLY